jgi:type VI secretion system protein ImpL
LQDALAAFTAEFKRWVGVLEQRMFARLQSEASPARRALVSAFPAQFATVGAPVTEFLGEAFAPRASERAPLLRGVYLTSATQEGTPIDRLTGALARAFGLEAAQARRLRPEEGRTFFLTGLLRDVIFREAMLVSASPAARRRAVLLRSAGFAACLLMALAGAALLWRQRAGAEGDIDRARTALAGYEQEASTLPLDPVRDADLPRLLPLLDRARALPFGYDQPNPAGSGPLGLSQDGKLGAAARAVYRHGLEYALFPRLIWRLEAQLRGNLSDPDFEYEGTRVYLMLGGAGPLDRDLVRQWMTLDWEQTDKTELQADLRRHLDALLESPLPQVALDGPLVAAARATFARVSVAQRIYSRIKPSAAASRLPPWRPSDSLGAAGVTVFIRASGRPLTDGIPGFFTPAGFRDVLLPSLGPALKDVAAESWVLGEKTDLQPDSPAMRAAGQDVVKLYTTDYVGAWDAMLADLDVAPLRSLTQAAQDLFILSSREHSPMRALLASIAQNTALGAAAPAPAPPASTEHDRLAALLGRTAVAAEPAAQPGQAVDDHFKPLHELMRPGAIDQVLKPLSDLQQQLAKMAASANKAGATTDPGSADPAVALQTEALRQPQPLARWLASVAASGRALRGGGVKEQITAAFKAGGGIGALCPQVVTDKYPFTPGSDKDASLDEFGRLFGAGGVLDAFFNTQLRPYVDASGRAWKLQPVEGVSAPIASADLQQFQRAAAIRDMFFAGGGTSPKLRVDLTPLGAEPGGTSATLDLSSATLQASGGPPRPAQITWPPAKPAPASLSWSPPGGSPGWQESGPWALFRLFGRGSIAPSGADRAVLTMHDGERSARFEIRSALNPFTSRLLQEFRCPALQ